MTRRSVAASDLLDQAEVARLLGVQPSSLRAMLAQPERHRRIDGIPRPIRYVGNAPVWDRRQVEAWMAG